MQVHEQNAVTIITVINDECAGMLKLVESMIERGRLLYVFDLAPANFLNSVNVAAIIATRNRIVAAGGKVVICNLSDNIRTVFRILKLDRLFDLSLDLAQAIKLIS